MAGVEREGVVRDENTGEMIIPSSQRPDGTWRKARRVKDGYIPQEEVPVFESKGTQWVKSRPTHPIGLAPDDVEKMKQAKKATEVDAPAQAHTSKAAKKNAKRKEKKKQEQASQLVQEVTKAVQQTQISNTKDTSGSGSGNGGVSVSKSDLAKKLKNLKKKLKQIKDLESKMKSGELKSPDQDQLEKVSRKQAVLDEIEDIEIEMEDS